MKLLFVRHAETDWNKANRFQGIVDRNLNENGKKQAKLLSDYLLSLREEYIVGRIDLQKIEYEENLESKFYLTLQDMRTSVRNFKSKLKSGDVGLIYFSGHGMSYDGIHWFCPCRMPPFEPPKGISTNAHL